MINDVGEGNSSQISPVSIADAVDVYAEALGDFSETTTALERRVIETLADDGVDVLFVQGRTKTPESLARKLARLDAAGRDFDDPVREMHDLSGLRIITALPEQVPDVVRSLKRGRWFYCLRDQEKDTTIRESGVYGYISRHLVCAVRSTGELGKAEIPLTSASTGAAHRRTSRAVTFEIQVRTILSHAWAEIEHDIRYKNPNPVAWTPALDRAFTQTASLIEAAETAFASIHDNHQQLLRWHKEPEKLNSKNLTELCDIVLPHVDRNTEESLEFAVQLLADNDITSTRELMDLISAEDVTLVRKRMAHSYEPGLARLIDDLLLQRYGEKHIAATVQHGGEDREAKLRSRLRLLTEPEAEPEDA
ncbi:hypothetical protein LWF01_04420 [Saxibacter everestensis]|uniref:RelA/SpoT domain-containing protein n=1 Tax=Saxibacter everestensis TaxID=2909229 RepID=A0ABY8QXW7_9MICO|nr:hypothetical protein LWF01_04420 [Brevibacteriaceae bacterium ZFBP1038]